VVIYILALCFSFNSVLTFGFGAADRFLELARQGADFLAQRPEARPHPHWAARHQTLRFWVISRTNYLIYYFLDEQGVSIERVLDGRRDVSHIMEQGEA